ncbi:MAG: hypothetical protein LBC99_06590 [Spirochaetota bacterium]|jgi:hypothetical protein|nr:hypothetical protein [Spirochaetota bacterium]
MGGIEITNVSNKTVLLGDNYFHSGKITLAAGAVLAVGGRAVLYVQRNEYDRTIGLCRLSLGLKLKDAENE